MTDKERFEECFDADERDYIRREQLALKRRFYYNSQYGKKLIKFYIEMTDDSMQVISSSADKVVSLGSVDYSKLPF